MEIFKRIGRAVRFTFGLIGAAVAALGLAWLYTLKRRAPDEEVSDAEAEINALAEAGDTAALRERRLRVLKDRR